MTPTCARRIRYCSKCSGTDFRRSRKRWPHSFSAPATPCSSRRPSDFGAALVSPDGEVVAAPVNTGIALMVGVPCDVAIRHSNELGVEAGDVFVSNDVWDTGGMATHLPDIYVWRPIFHDGQVVCYAWAFVHSSDVGGIVPGSIAPSSHEIYQEGVRIPVSKLFRRGELNRELLRFIMANCRIPDQNWGDIKAMVSGLDARRAARREH